jgi:YYY domain-containing protein
MVGDIYMVLIWWGVLFLIGAAAYPITRNLFSSWFDRGYLFAKAVGLVIVSYIIWLGGSLKILPFTVGSAAAVTAVMFAVGLIIDKIIRVQGLAVDGNRPPENKNPASVNGKHVFFTYLFKELFFLLALGFWAWIKAHEPSIHGLEKFMDFGFTKSILNTTYLPGNGKIFPPPDIWYSGYTINYYYFGHLVMAILTRLSGIDLRYTFNLMLASLFAFTFTMSFSIGYQLLHLGGKGNWGDLGAKTKFFGGLLTAFLVTSAGNMQTIYAFTQGYSGDNVKPFWQLLWPIGQFWQDLPQGLSTYWYANATRFIPFTIHEFPSYSFVVSDVHGHVLSLPFVLLAIALIFAIFGVRGNKGDEGNPGDTLRFLFFGILLAVLFMTNVLDAPIYGGLLVILILFYRNTYPFFSLSWWENKAGQLLPVAVAGPAILPFLLNFKAFVSGVGVNCPPAKLANSKFGPILFETVDKCQHSPLWMMWLLWGFFWFCGVFLFVSAIRLKQNKKFKLNIQFTRVEWILGIFFVYCLGLIIFPEFFYFKDIYPSYFRSNTMFKLGYQAFIMFSIMSGYTIIKYLRLKILDFRLKILKTVFIILLIPQFFLVAIFPIFAVRSYFNSLIQYQGLDGLKWLRDQYPDDYEGIVWLDGQIVKNAPSAPTDLPIAPTPNPSSVAASDREPPVIVEADGDSYTDYARFSAFTGLPAVIGWPVHEWLWRGTYDIVGPRRTDVQTIYESRDVDATRTILQKYHVKYIIIGTLEQSKYKIDRVKIDLLAKPLFTGGQTVIYEVIPDASGS